MSQRDNNHEFGFIVHDHAELAGKEIIALLRNLLRDEEVRDALIGVTEVIRMSMTELALTLKRLERRLNPLDRN